MTCPKCGSTERTKPYRDHPNGGCAPCHRAINAASYAAHREERRAHGAKYDAAHPNRHINEAIARLRRATEHFYGGNTDGSSIPQSKG
jgi:hypothetical protein